MVRYLAVVVSGGSPSDRQLAASIRAKVRGLDPRWRPVLDRPDCWAAELPHEFSPQSAIPLSDSEGVVLGSIFTAPDGAFERPPRRKYSFAEIEQRRITESRGCSLVTDYWGHYVALVRSADGTARVLRSPVSSLACHYVRTGHVTIVFSYIEDLIALGVVALTINWDCITAQVVGGDYLTRETGITEVFALDCGVCLELNPAGCIERRYWDPSRSMTHTTSEEFGHASKRLERAIQYCVDAHSMPHANLLVTLSGGLDSSIVLSGLSNAAHRPHITAVTSYSAGSGDERFFARAMARFAGCRLIERQRNERLDLREKFSNCNWTVQPVLNFSAPDSELAMIALARDLSASAIVDGELGDNVFGSDPGPGALIESFRRHQFGSRFLVAAVDFAMLTRRSVWRTLALAYQLQVRLSRQSNLSIGQELLQRYGAEAVKAMFMASSGAMESHRAKEMRFLQPWVTSAPVVLGGRRSLFYGLAVVTSSAYHSPFASPLDPPRLSPLLSQPLVEMILTTPPYFHFRGGQNRALARDAFAHRLPASVLDRGTAKGGPVLWAKQVIEHNAEFVRDFLLRGALVERGLLDPEKVERALSASVEKSAPIIGDVFAKLYIEAWLRKWLSLGDGSVRPSVAGTPSCAGDPGAGANAGTVLPSRAWDLHNSATRI